MAPPGVVIFNYRSPPVTGVSRVVQYNKTAVPVYQNDFLSLGRCLMTVANPFRQCDKTLLPSCRCESSTGSIENFANLHAKLFGWELQFLVSFHYNQSGNHAQIFNLCFLNFEVQSSTFLGFFFQKWLNIRNRSVFNRTIVRRNKC